MSSTRSARLLMVLLLLTHAAAICQHLHTKTHNLAFFAPHPAHIPQREGISIDRIPSEATWPSPRLSTGVSFRAAVRGKKLIMRQRGGGGAAISLSQGGALLKSQALPVGLMIAILMGLWQPRWGCAVGELGFIKFAPHCIFFIGGLLLRWGFGCPCAASLGLPGVLD